jgi:uncharacterized protein (TIGR00288 family)
MDDAGGSVALYWDFENIHASLHEARHGKNAYQQKDARFTAQEPLVDVQMITELAATFGPIAINRAYGNWQYFGRYRDALLQSAVELIQLFPPGASAKNGADIKLCLDATEDLTRFAHIETLVIVGGDSDFMPVAQKIKAAGRTLIGIGARANTNKHWAKSCHDFRYYESLVTTSEEEQSTEDTVNKSEQPYTGSHSRKPAVPPDPVADILHRAIRLLAEKKGDEWVNKGPIWPMLKRLDSTFDLGEHGYANFPALIDAYRAKGTLELRAGKFDQEVRLKN